MKLIIPVFKNKNELLSRKKYWLSSIIWWLYTLIWLIILLLVWYFWDVAFLYKVIVNLILIFGTPSFSDLIKSYDKYKEEWGKQKGIES